MTATARPLRILITNNTLSVRAGSEVYVRDLAIALMKRGHFPVAYSPVLGRIADELRAHTIPVIDNLRQMDQAPDLIHGHHHHETMTAMLHYPDTPAIFVCHGWVPWEETPAAFPNIMRYVAVDSLCRERLLTTEHVDPTKVSVIHNFVDCALFDTVRELPEKPRKALVFSNYASDIREPIRRACEAAGIDQIDVAGSGSGNAIEMPSKVLPDYDVVFAKARAAIEAMASGCAVIVSHHAGLAGLVTRDRLERMRDLNFGIRTMQAQRLTAETLGAELARYDRDDARAVTGWIRENANLETAVDAWLSLYAQALADWPQAREARSPQDLMRAAAVYLNSMAPVLKTAQKSAAQRDSARARAEKLQKEVDRLRALRRKEGAGETPSG